jgi:hypothetical protein
MEPICGTILLILAAVVLVGAVLVGIVVLLKLGVIVRYAGKEEPPDSGDYGLDQSHESGER